jgi:hypothetical protein
MTSFDDETARCGELLACFRKGAEGHCAIVDSSTTWVGERYTEMHKNGDWMTVGGVKMPLWTEFLVCAEHAPRKVVFAPWSIQVKLMDAVFRSLSKVDRMVYLDRGLKAERIR